MSKNDDSSKFGEQLKDDFKSIFKHSKLAMGNIFRGSGRKSSWAGLNRGFSPFFSKNPFWCLFYPKIIVAAIILLTLLLCGVSIYGLIIIILLAVIFILI
ncbi:MULTISPECIES: hypothetical protein [unclassified Clostridium]|uniref:hypothetical protein n=1 Tax=unclassified Clostridium TaxID=2614128 RepID=UPI00023AEFF9|nr:MULTISPECIES: hypothetical protein [unclassified Clostridium]EHI98098.1 hypothetical protein CDLVIII_1399 [Clostridium sp. DL-VIII]OOM81558.1 hypothetical protein CLOBL_00010 [Clostridium sp. BL-8]